MKNRVRKIKVLDNFLDETEFSNIQDFLIGKSRASFPWYYSNVVTNEDPKEHFQFIHIFYANFGPSSDFFPVISNLILKLKIKSLVRIKANLLTTTQEIIEYKFHYDQPERNTGMKVAIFYLNTNNGYTLFEDGRKVESVQNRMVVFDGDMAHTGTSCTDQNVRAVINFNYF